MELTKDERRLSYVMGILAIAFLITDAIFVFATPQLFTALNWFGGKLFGLDPAPVPSDKLYLALTNSLMLMLAFIAFMVWRDPGKNLSLIPPLLICKFVSSASGLLFFLYSAGYFTHLIIPVTDFPIFIIVLYLYTRVKRASH